ncbi:membrane protein insertion efficiency factor YidD [Chitinivorax sp. B]|uniref:membrane protein insertion efficiency factor YidD n=1 Tax=Chitinivorax sp. B TaxID=2502235 RepID=UPI0010F4D086|nr:membrane protein insertion efficiency factor YidD [Chitinivorax sp. B]
MRQIVLLLIRCYQRFISPYKGFSCAYRIHTGYASCSVLGYRAIRRYGVWMGLGILQERMHCCALAHAHYGPIHRRRLVQQRGDCDPGCDLPCDSPGGNGLGRFCDVLDCCDCGCDWPRRKRREPKKRRWGKDKYLPPQH